MASRCKPSEHGAVKMNSSKPSKQRKRMFRSPLHRRRRMLAANLSDELRQKYGVRGISLREGDSVRIMRGDFEGLEGKIEKVEYETGRIFVEGMTREKTAGVASKLPVHASKVRITNLNLSDKWRSGLLAEKGKEEK